MTGHPSSRPIVYLGPTLARERAERLLPTADYRPPVKRGDLPARHDGTVVIIDGDFHQSLSVSPKEILRLLDDGTRVVGASSMGALRAAELWPLGMEGCGWVFECYKSGRIVADDEVAVTYERDGLQPLTVPLVNVRRWLEDLVSNGQLDSVTARRLLMSARRIFYADRSERALFQEWEKVLSPADVQQLLSVSGGQISDVKAADAEVALAHVAQAASNIRGRR